MLDPQMLEFITYMSKVDSPTGLAMFFYMAFRFKKLEDKMSSLNDKLEQFVVRVMKVEQDLNDWIYTDED